MRALVIPLAAHRRPSSSRPVRRPSLSFLSGVAAGTFAAEAGRPSAANRASTLRAMAGWSTGSPAYTGGTAFSSFPPPALVEWQNADVVLTIIEGVHDESGEDAHRPAPLLKRHGSAKLK